MSRPDLSALRIDERSRRSSRRLGWRAIAVALVVVLAGAIGLFVALRDKAPEVEVATVRADKGGRAALLNASGYVTPRQRATIAAKITARVNEIYVDEGLQVEPGQVLARLDDSDARARLTSAMAERDATAATLGDLRVNLDNAERELKRVDELWERKLVAEQTRDQARMAVDSLKARLVVAREQVSVAEARVKVAQQDLDNCTVRAPFGGIVVSKDAQRGEMVSPVSAGGGFTRTGIATIVDMASLEIEVDVNESYIARVKTGQPVTAVLDAYPDWQIPAKVRTVIPTADRLDPRILPDMGVKVTFLGEERSVPVEAAGRVLVSRAALIEEGGTTAVFVHREGRVERRAIRLGQARGNEHEVVAGLSDGEQVVTTGAKQLRDGQSVRLKR